MVIRINLFLVFFKWKEVTLKKLTTTAPKSVNLRDPAAQVFVKNYLQIIRRLFKPAKDKLKTKNR